MPRRRDVIPRAIDWAGAALLAAATTSLLLGLVWGGREYAWNSPQVIGALAVAVVLAVAFGLWERRVEEPILPFDILQNRIVLSSVLCMALDRDGDVRDDRVRAALRAGRDRHVGDVVGRRAHAADARRGHDVVPRGPVGLAHRAATGRTRSSGRSSSRSGCSCSGAWTCTRRTARRRATWSSPASGSAR